MTPTKNDPEKKMVFFAFQLVKAQGFGAFKALAIELDKSPSSVCISLKKTRIHWFNSMDYTEAINKVFGFTYTREELFGVFVDYNSR